MKIDHIPELCLQDYQHLQNVRYIILQKFFAPAENIDNHLIK
jgi:hypothetical protein